MAIVKVIWQRKWTYFQIQWQILSLHLLGQPIALDTLIQCQKHPLLPLHWYHSSPSQLPSPLYHCTTLLTVLLAFVLTHYPFFPCNKLFLMKQPNDLILLLKIFHQLLVLFRVKINIFTKAYEALRFWPSVQPHCSLFSFWSIIYNYTGLFPVCQGDQACTLWESQKERRERKERRAYLKI